MTPEQYQAARARASLGLLAALRPLARLLRPRPTAAERAAWVDAAYPAVYRARVDHHAAAAEFYLAERARFGITGQTPVPLRNYAPSALDTALREENVWGRLDALDDDAPVPTVIVNQAVAIADRHGAAGGRDAIVDAARHDRRALGYARTTTGLENCAFCLLLVSRGPVYKSEDTALLRDGTGEPYHDRCDCIAVPVYDRNDWPGRDEYLEMEAAWREHGGDLQSWRTYIESREQDQNPEPSPDTPSSGQEQAAPAAPAAGGGQPPADPPPRPASGADDPDQPLLGDLVPVDEDDAEDRIGDIEDAVAEVIEGEYTGRDGTTFQVSVDSVSAGEDDISVQGQINVNGLDVGEFSREFLRDDQGALWANHDELKLDADYQGRGFAPVFNGRLEDWYRRSGVDRIELVAGYNVGPYAWATQGYDFLNEEEAELAVTRLEREADRIEQWLDDHEDDDSVDDAEYERQEDLLEAAQDIIQRSSGPFGTDDYPSAYEISQLGRLPGQGRADSWIGKIVMLAISWRGVKYLR